MNFGDTSVSFHTLRRQSFASLPSMITAHGVRPWSYVIASVLLAASVAAQEPSRPPSSKFKQSGTSCGQYAAGASCGRSECGDRKNSDEERKDEETQKE